MKRTARDMDLQLVARDMQLALRDAPADAITALLANAADPILDALRNRPELILTMMQLSTQINRLWSAVPDLWITLIDQIIVHDYPPNTQFTYAFCHLQHRRATAHYTILRDKFDWSALDAVDKMVRDGRLIDTRERISNTIARNGESSVTDGRLGPLCRLGTVFYSGHLVERYVVLVYCIEHVRETLVWQPFNMRRSGTAMGIAASGLNILGDYVVVLDDDNDATPLVHRLRDTVQIVVDELNRYSHGPMLGETVEIVVADDDGKPAKGKFYALGVAQALDTITRMADALLYALRQSIAWAEAEPAPSEPATTDARLRSTLVEMRLTEATGLVFHRTLWRDVYNEVDQQREHLFRLMRARRSKEEQRKAAEEWERWREEREAVWAEEAREARGRAAGWDDFDIDSHLRCAACGLRAEHVDARAQLPFCTDALCGQLRPLYATATQQ